MATLRLRPHQDDDQVGVDAVGDEHLGAADAVGITFAAADRQHVLVVRPTRWLGYTEGDDFVALDRGRQPALPLRVIAVLADRWRGNRDMGADPGGHPPRPATRELFEKDGFVDDAGVGAPVLLRIFEAQQIEGAKALEKLSRKLLGFLPFIDMRADLLVDEATNGAPKFLVLGPKEVRARHAYVCQ